MGHGARLERLRERLERPLLVTHLPNLRYLTGFAGSNGYLLAGSRGDVFVTDGRYGEAAGPLVEALPEVELEVYQGSVWPVLGAVLDGLPEVGLESGAVTWSFVRRLAEETGVEPVPTEDAVEDLRAVKDAEEIEALTRAAGAGDTAFARLGELAGAATEADLAWALQDAMRGSGGEPADWAPIVAAGPNAALPHHRAGSAPLGPGLLLLDYGCLVDGYHSDMSRTVWLERPGEPSGEEGSRGEWKKVHEAVLRAQEAALAAVQPGVPAGRVDGVAREVLDRYGYAEHFVHSTGHGVGLEIHERPWVRKDSEEVLEPGHVVTVEPGVYLPGRGGVRIEDMVVVTEGGPQVLTGSPKELG